MSIWSKLKMLSKFPPDVLLRKALNKFRHRRAHQSYLRQILPADQRVPKAGDSVRLKHFLYWDSLNFKAIEPDVAQWLIERTLEHRFDLLGSGWVKNSYQTEAFGLEGCRYENVSAIEPDPQGKWLEKVVLPAHLAYSQNLWKWILDLNAAYEPIDWQRDFKSGFRWDARVAYSAQRALMSDKPGVDLKVPWELSRLQHLPQLAALAERMNSRAGCVVDYMCQTLDFIMANPIGMGVNFNCPMDIGIRVANQLLAYDLFRDLIPPAHDARFESVLATYVMESCRHIAHDMEYREGLTSNHFLGNVLGLLFGAAWLSAGPDSDRFLAFGVQELVRSMDRQFFSDGSNFEGSTSYHRLSGEMMAMGAWLIGHFGEVERHRLRNYDHTPWNYSGPLLPANAQVYDVDAPNLLPSRFYEKLWKSARFSALITKPSGHIPQFGDNDSGRFFRLSPRGRFMPSAEASTHFLHIAPAYWQMNGYRVLWEEDALCHQPFISLVDGLFGDGGIQQSCALEASLGQACIQSGLPSARLDEADKVQVNATEIRELPFVNKRHFELWDHLPHGLECHNFPDFQLSLIRGDSFYVALAGISNPAQHHSLSHVHNDKLQVELEFNGRSILRDPGTYLYTPLPEWRTRFRSVHAHNTAVVNGHEQNNPLQGRLGLFNMMREVQFTQEIVSITCLQGSVRYRDVWHRRRVDILQSGVCITDWCNQDFEVNFTPFEFNSPGYGKKWKQAT